MLPPFTHAIPGFDSLEIHSVFTTRALNGFLIFRFTLLTLCDCFQMCLLQLYESNCCITKWKLRSNPLQQNLIGGFVFPLSLMFSSIHLLFSLCLVGYRDNMHTICFGSPTCTNPGCVDAHRVYFSWYLSCLQDCFEIDIVCFSTHEDGCGSLPLLSL